MHEQSLMRLIELVYAAACDADGWPRLLEALTEALGGSGADLIAYDLDRGGHQIHHGVGIIGPDFKREYLAVAPLDPFFTRGKARGLFSAGTVGISEELVPWSELERTEFYNEFGKRHEYIGGMAGVIAADERSGACVGVMRRRGQPFGEAEATLIRALLPHLKRALQVHMRLLEADTRQRELRSVLACVASGALLVSAAGGVVFANDSAQETLARHDGLSLDRGILRAGHGHDNATLHALIAAAIETSSGAGCESGGVLWLERPSGRRPLHLVVSPVPPTDALGETRACAIVFINDPDRTQEADLALLRLVHGLTRAETDVAGLLLGDRTVLEIGDLLGITANTVRFHLKQLFAKTGTRRQSELVRLLLSTAQVRRPISSQH